MRRKKPGDIRAILESDIVQSIDAEELGKFFRFAVELSKMDTFLKDRSRNIYQEDWGWLPNWHGDGIIDVNRAFIAAHSKPTHSVALADIDLGDTSNITPKIQSRVDSANLNFPLIVQQLPNGKYIRIDGYHRGLKAKQTGQTKVRVKIITRAETEKSVVMSEKDLLKDDPNDYIRSAAPIEPYSDTNLEWLDQYKTGLALEQDASSSGAQIIALTTRNKKLAELSNVVPTNQKQRLYDLVARAAFNDPRFKELNKKLGLTEKDLRKASKAQSMVSFYGAGERTGILNVEGKLAKALGKDTDTLVIRASERDTVLNEISARAARYDRFDPEMAASLRSLRQDARDVFNKGLDPGDELMSQLWFLDPKTRDLVEKISRNYNKVVTPDDFKIIAKIMSEELAEQVPILKDFTKFFGRLAEDFLINAKPSKAAFDMKSVFKIAALGKKSKGIKFSKPVAKLLGLSPNQTHSLDAIERLPFWKKDGSLSDLLFGKSVPNQRRTGVKILKKKFLGKTIADGFEIFYANKMPKSWTSVPWVNFDGKVIEQNFTQTFEERLLYKDKNGNWMTNIVQVPQKTEASWWDQVTGEEGKINDIADATKARTAFGVNGNHSNDAVIVKKFHLWGAKNDIATSTINKYCRG